MMDTKRRAASPSAARFAPAGRRRHQRNAPEQAPRYLAIGRIVAPRGLRGELKVRPETDDPSRFEALRVVYLGDDRAPFAVRGVRFFKEQVLLQLEGIDSPEQAEAWRDAYIWIPEEEALPLEAGQYYCYQIEGLTVMTVEGEALGRVAEVLSTGANDVYVIRNDREEILLPAIRDVIVKVDLANAQLIVKLLDGLR